MVAAFLPMLEAPAGLWHWKTPSPLRFLPRYPKTLKDMEAFLAKYPGDDSDHEEERPPVVPVAREKPETTRESVLNFVFPSHLRHPMSTGRLYALALYGPRIQLRDWELDEMCAQFEREDILSVYVQGTLSQEEQAQIIAQADIRPSQISREEVNELFSADFHQFQRAILEYRARRIASMKRMYPPLRVSPKQTPQSAKRATGDLLSTRAFQICAIQDGNLPDLTANVRLVRSDHPENQLGGRFDCVTKPIMDTTCRLALINTLRHN